MANRVPGIVMPYAGDIGVSQPYAGAFGKPGVQPYYGKPGVQPYYGKPGVQPYYGKPGVQPYYGKPGVQPYYGKGGIPYWAPTAGGGLAKQYPPGTAGIPYAFYPGYGLVQ